MGQHDQRAYKSFNVSVSAKVSMQPVFTVKSLQFLARINHILVFNPEIIPVYDVFRLVKMLRIALKVNVVNGICSRKSPLC
jgi:hypothetical protein